MATKFLLFSTKAEAEAKELELRNLTKCTNAGAKTTRYADVIANKDGTFMIPIRPVYNHETKQIVDVANAILLPAEKAALLDKTAPAVKGSLEQDTTIKK